MKALEAMLDVPPDTIYSLVVFVGDSKFKTEMPENVTFCHGCISYIKSFQEPVLEVDEIQAAVSQIRSGRLSPSFSTHRQHVRQLKTRADSYAERNCPRCGSALILSTSKRGTHAGSQFWGCSAYPKCRVVQNLGK